MNLSNRTLTLLLAASLLAAAGACEPVPDDPSPGSAGELQLPGPGQMWIANRGDGTLSVIDTRSDALIGTLPMPDGGEPMYVNYARGLVFVGDRANDRVVAFDPTTGEARGSILTGEGVFHQWTTPDGDQLWVNNDVSRTTTVIDTVSLKMLAQIPMPTDLAARPGAGEGQPRPHDVLVAPDGSAAFVSYLGFEGESDYVVRFDATTFEETHRARVGKDPHLSATATNDLLYVPCQESDEIVLLGRADLSERGNQPLPGAHGVGMTHRGQHLYLTNLPGEGEMALFAVDTATNTLVSGVGVDAPREGKPHNLAVAGDDTKLYVTHSGPGASLVSVYTIGPDRPVPSGPATEVRVGANPFGLGFVPVVSSGTGVLGEELRSLRLDVSRLSTLRDGHHYEGWAIIDGAPVSTGKFNVDASGAATDLDGIAIADGIFDTGRDLREAAAFVITIELPGDVDIVPNETHYLAGDLRGAVSTLTVAHPDALGTGFGDAEGAFILATPTDGPDTHETSGVWFLSLHMAEPKPGLALPTLPAGWDYEGWAVIDGIPVSTGKFLFGDAPDDDDRHSGPEAAPPFPGEDFLHAAPEGLRFPTDLSDATIVISVEPQPDDSPAPFLLKPLVGSVPANTNHHQTFLMSRPTDGLPVVKATLVE